MKNLVTIIGLLSMSLTVSARADVNLIQSQIKGNGYMTMGKTVSVLSPTIVLDGQTYELHTGSITAKSACEMLGLSYLSYDQGEGKLAKRVRLDQNGSIEFVDGNRSLSVINCTGN